ncbi:type I-E CRISPR-associated protein Cas5/CasD [Streptomyces sp. RK23]|uniref:type I-E CRISPR-associated protein Cas5/CasD n=1 Tax=unclassified Streptomyces TaxID=2593676 RepID=UPI001B375221|nr:MULTISPECIES: type I-E CRISPR-associated protein Cas5/CasD [unclassified Streptomyces]MBQ0967488.1 type I-E CRISPR-associated protein Cas5/CasD [Streptomyces sp. RK74B]MBQ1008066.1 type I-E CRISPR-associated protein Cas5/CasD [Streptomyces sp. RK23]
MSSTGVLVLRLAGPLQSWGASSRFTRRTTESAPTKSGVIGLLASAAGIDRSDDTNLAPLAALRFGVRIDQPGTRIRDFHTAHHGVTGASMPLSERFYLADAVFVAAVEGDQALLAGLHDALRAPVYLPYLGRRSCPPSEPVDLALYEDTTLENVLANVPWQASAWYRRRHRTPQSLTVLRERSTEEPAESADVLRDQPVSFDAAHRRHALRTVVTTAVPTPIPAGGASPQGPHDPFAALDALENESA